MPRYEFTVTSRTRTVHRAYVEIVAEDLGAAALALEEHLEQNTCDDPDGLPIDWEEVVDYYDMANIEVDNGREVREPESRVDWSKVPEVMSPNEYHFKEDD